MFTLARRTQGCLKRCRSALGVTLLMCACACTSALEHFEAGQQLESAGEYAQAAARYIAALEQDATLTGARDRLDALIPTVLSLWLDQARLDQAGGRPVDAAERFLGMDEFVADALAVGMRPDPGPEYPSLRRVAFDDAIDLLFLDGTEDRRRGRFESALTAFERVRRYDPEAIWRQQVQEELAHTHLEWARRELSEGRFRAAFDQADLVIAALGAPAAPWAELADALQAEALDAGTVRVAVVPVTAHPDAAARLSDTTVGTLNDELVLGPWQDPPLFVALLDQAVVTSHIRREGYVVNDLTDRDARRLARELDADVLVRAQIAEPTATEERPDAQPRPVQTNAGESATYRFVRGRLRVELAIAFTLLDVDRGETSREYRADARADGFFERAEYDGDWTELRLSSAEERLFNGETVQDARRPLEAEVIPTLAERFGDAVFRRVLERVP